MVTPQGNKEYIRCNLCGNDSYSYLDYEGGNRVVRCNICGLVYRNPRPLITTDRETDSIRNYGDYSVTEANVSIARDKIFKKALRTLERVVSKPTKYLLDIGCGQGYFLKLAKESGWGVRGVEPVKSACEYGNMEYGINILNAGIEDAKFEDETFDAVTLWNVLDHLPDPKRVLQEAKRALRPQGSLLIRVPNVSSHMAMHAVFSFLPVWLRGGRIKDPSVIINFGFTNRTIKRLLREVGFEKVKIGNSPLSSGDPYRCLTALGNLATILFKYLYFGISQVIYYLSFGKLTIGPALWVLAIK